MSTAQTLAIGSTSLENTLRLAASVGSKLRGGETIELVSDLGGGKTAFVRGLAQGMGSSDTVNSPSFTISREYVAAELTLHHFDFYRLHEAGIIAQELHELTTDPKAVIAIEWADIVEGVLPAERLRISIRNVGETSRELTFEYPEALNYLMSEIK